MTVHDFLQSFQYGERKKIPSNCLASDLVYYAASRFQIWLEIRGEYLIRICPYCRSF